MQKGRGIVYDDVSKCVDEVITYIGKDICFGMPWLWETSSLC